MIHQLFLHSPSPIREAAFSWAGWKANRQRRGSHFHEQYPRLLSNLTRSRDELDELQARELSALLRDAEFYSSFYAARISAARERCQARVIERDPTAFEILAEMPFLEKDDLREESQRIVSHDPRRSTVATTHTSGTTGTPLVVEVDSESVQRSFAEWERYYRWMGLKEGFRSARFSGRILVRPETKKPPFWVMNRASGQLFMSTYHMTEQNLYAYVRELNRFKPHLIDGYPSAITIISKFILETGIELSFTPQAISTTAETLHDHQRVDIERAFGCAVFNQYASSEGAPWIVQCSAGAYHLWTDTGVFEFVNPRNDGTGRRIADLLVTSFRAKKTPLIRYNIGDVVITDPIEPDIACQCGSEFPRVGGVIGRDEDLVVTRHRGAVGRLDTAFKGLTGILRSKIVQHSLDDVEVYLVVSDSYSSSTEQQLVANLRERLGAINIRMTLVDSIPLGRSGKFKAVESLIPLDQRRI